MPNHTGRVDSDSLKWVRKMKSAINRDYGIWIQIAQDALSAVERLLDSKDAEKFKLELTKLLAAVRQRRASVRSIVKLLAESPPIRNWAKRRLTRMATQNLRPKMYPASELRRAKHQLNRAIARLEAAASVGKRATSRSKKRGGITPALSRQLSELMMKRWTARKKKARARLGEWPGRGGGNGWPSLGAPVAIRKRGDRVSLGRAGSVGDDRFQKQKARGAERIRGKGAAMAKKSFRQVRVFFGTNRKQTGNKKPDKFFAAERGELSLGSVDVSIPHDHRMGKLEGPAWLKLQFRQDPAKHIVLLSLQVLARAEFIQSLQESFRQGPSKEALLFVHGYNVRFKDACRRTAQIAYDLKFKGVPIAYSWPSEGKFGLYTVDETNVTWSVPHFQKFLNLVLSETGAEVVHVIAHSMGNRALVEALRRFQARDLPIGSARLTQVIFAAPDIDADTFQDLAEEFCQKAARLTLYASSKDIALRASKRFHKYSRAGDSGEDLVLLDGVDTIDATTVDTGLMGHSYIGDNETILSDVYDLLRDGSPPTRRFRLHRRERSGREYWMFQP